MGESGYAPSSIKSPGRGCGWAATEPFPERNREFQGPRCRGQPLAGCFFRVKPEGNQMRPVDLSLRETRKFPRQKTTPVFGVTPRDWVGLA